MTPLTYQIRRDEYNQFFLVAKRGAILVGSAEGYPTDEGALYVKWLGVEPRYRRHGYGAAMVSALEESAVQWGYKVIVLNPADQRAISFWEAMGYRKTREYRAWSKSLSGTLRELAPANPTVGPPLPQGLRQFWPNQPADP